MGQTTSSNSATNMLAISMPMRATASMRTKFLMKSFVDLMRAIQEPPNEQDLRLARNRPDVPTSRADVPCEAGRSTATQAKNSNQYEFPHISLPNTGKVALVAEDNQACFLRKCESPAKTILAQNFPLFFNVGLRNSHSCPHNRLSEAAHFLRISLEFAHFELRKRVTRHLYIPANLYANFVRILWCATMFAI